MSKVKRLLAYCFTLYSFKFDMQHNPTRKEVRFWTGPTKVEGLKKLCFICFIFSVRLLYAPLLLNKLKTD